MLFLLDLSQGFIGVVVSLMKKKQTNSHGLNELFVKKVVKRPI